MRGVEFFTFEPARIEWRYSPLAPAFVPRFMPRSYMASATMSLDRDAAARLRRFIEGVRPRYGASFATLMRRASYGGRKGRRAWRRLLAMPDSAWRDGLRVPSGA